MIDSAALKLPWSALIMMLPVEPSPLLQWISVFDVVFLPTLISPSQTPSTVILAVPVRAPPVPPMVISAPSPTSSFHSTQPLKSPRIKISPRALGENSVRSFSILISPAIDPEISIVP